MTSSLMISPEIRRLIPLTHLIAFTVKQQEIKEILPGGFHPGKAECPFTFTVIFQNATFAIKEQDHAACSLDQRTITFLTAAQIIFRLTAFGDVGNRDAITQKRSTFATNFGSIDPHPKLAAILTAHFDIARLNPCPGYEVATQIPQILGPGIKLFTIGNIGLAQFANIVIAKQCRSFFVQTGQGAIGGQIDNTVHRMFKGTAIAFLAGAFLPEKCNRILCR